MRAARPQRQCYSASNAPPHLHARARSGVGHVTLFQPFLQVSGDSVDCHQTCPVLIKKLLSWCGPSDVPWSIRAIAVWKTINRMLWSRPEPQASKELLERRKQEPNTTPSVPLVTPGIRICAAGFGRAVGGILRELRLSVSAVALRQACRVQASARPSMIIAQPFPCVGPIGSALAQAKPHFFAEIRDGGKAPEYLTRYIYQPGINLARKGCRIACHKIRVLTGSLLLNCEGGQA